MQSIPDSVHALAAERDIDIAVYGATGFVGKLTAEYLAGNAPEGVKVALAGRNEQKLEQVRSELGVDWPLIVADSSDKAALKAMAERCRAIATTVGPYRKYGMDLVAACAAAGTDYADLTGEPLFIRDVIDQHNDTAAASGARIVPCCGFDSIPSDIGVYLLNERVKADGEGDLEQTTLIVRGMKGGASGGTIDSMRTMMEEVRSDPAKRKVAQDPYGLSPDRSAEPDLGKQPDARGPWYHEDAQTWLGPFVMAAINTRVVRRSNALQEWTYGRKLKYGETIATGDGVAGRAKALALTGGMGALVGAMSAGPTRNLLGRVLPKPGEGPSEEAREKGFFKIEIHTRTSTGAHYVCKIAAQGDPGYKATAVMLGESALAFVVDRDKLPERTGVLTPATAFDGVLAERLRAAGHTYEASRA